FRRTPNLIVFPYATLFRSGAVGRGGPAVAHTNRRGGVGRLERVAPHVLPGLLEAVRERGELRYDGRQLILRQRAGPELLLVDQRSEEHTSELQSRFDLVCR